MLLQTGCSCSVRLRLTAFGWPATTDCISLLSSLIPSNQCPSTKQSCLPRLRGRQSAHVDHVQSQCAFSDSERVRPYCNSIYLCLFSDSKTAFAAQDRRPKGGLHKRTACACAASEALCCNLTRCWLIRLYSDLSVTRGSRGFVSRALEQPAGNPIATANICSAANGGETYRVALPATMANWESTGLDPQLLRAVAKRELAAPTPVQAAAIPKASACYISGHEANVCAAPYP